MLYECLKHRDRLTQELNAAEGRILQLEGERTRAVAHLSDLKADESASTKSIDAARDEIPKLADKIRAAVAERDMLHDAVGKAYARAVDTGRVQWANEVSKRAAVVADPLSGLQDACKPFLAMADDLAGRWAAYMDAKESWSKTFPRERPVPKHPDPRPTLALRGVINRVTDAAVVLRQIIATVETLEPKQEINHD